MSYYTTYDSPLGQLVLFSDGNALTGLYMNRQKTEPAILKEDLPVFVQTRSWLDAYFRGEDPDVSEIPIALEGTPFQKIVWDLLLAIPYGQTRSYGDIAREMAQRMGKEKMSAQAVGQAVGRNPISILIPCHRVVGAKGQLTGYASGLDKKTWLLRHEGILM